MDFNDHTSSSSPRWTLEAIRQRWPARPCCLREPEEYAAWVQACAEAHFTSSEPYPHHGQSLYERIFPAPAITRRQRIEHKSALERTGAEKAYLETCDLLEAYPDAERGIRQALNDHQCGGGREAP